MVQGEMRYTPGPWDAPTAVGTKQTSVWTANGDTRIADCTSKATSLAGCRANAVLISAAPDLLNAALIFEEYCEAMDAGDDVTAMLKYAEAQTVRRAAIAKATGG